MNKSSSQTLKTLGGILLLAITAIMLTGCPEGGGGTGGGTVPPVNTNPVHTAFNSQPAFIYQAGVSYNTTVEYYETRGDEIHFNRMYTYRTFADTYNSGRTANYYNAGPALISGWMFDTQGTMRRDIRDAFIQNTSNNAGSVPNMLKAYERKTLRTTVMIGQQMQSKPAGFNGMFIPWDTYRQWSLAGNQGIRFWITLEGYDYKLDDNYNIHVPIEIMFPANLVADGSAPVNSGNDDDTDPYSPF